VTEKAEICEFTRVQNQEWHGRRRHETIYSGENLQAYERTSIRFLPSLLHRSRRTSRSRQEQKARGRQAEQSSRQAGRTGKT